jgi:hypothetical protein
MTYRIEIKADTLVELAGKAYAFAVGVQSASRAEWSPIKQDADIELEVAEAAPENPTPAPKSVPSAEASESQPTTTQPSITPAPTAVTEEAASSGQTEASAPPTEEKSSASAELNFDTDVAPIVLQVVKEKGKPVAQSILEEFGVERASQLDPARWPELVAQLKDAL